MIEPPKEMVKSTNLFFKPALPFRREECVHEVVVGLVGDLEGLLLDVPVDRLQHVVGQIPS